MIYILIALWLIETLLTVAMIPVMIAMVCVGMEYPTGH